MGIFSVVIGNIFLMEILPYWEYFPHFLEIFSVVTGNIFLIEIFSVLGIFSILGIFS